MTIKSSQNLGFDLVDKALALVLDSDSLENACKAFVFAPWNTSVCQGAFVYSLNRDADLVYEAGYGKGKDQVDICISKGADFNLETVFRHLSHDSHQINDLHVIFTPLVSKGTPVGLLCLVAQLGLPEDDLPAEFFQLASRSFGFFLVTKHPRGHMRTLSPPSKDTAQTELNSRQLAVLEGISRSLTNREIAGELHVSESTIRHECMRIFSFLNASDRFEAVSVARNAGYLSS